MRRKIAYKYTQKARLEYISKIDHILYLISEFEKSREDLNNFIAQENIKDVQFVKQILKDFGLEYDIIREVDVTAPNISIWDGMEKNLEALILHNLFVDRKIAKNKKRLDSEKELITNRNFLLKQVKNANLISGSLLKNKIKKYHQEKEIFLYSVKGRNTYIQDVLLDIKRTIYEIRNLIEEEKKNHLLFKYSYPFALKVTSHDTILDIKKALEIQKETILTIKPSL